MSKKHLTGLIIFIIVVSSLPATILDEQCNDTKKISSEFNYIRLNMGKIKAAFTNALSLQLKTRRITGPNNLKSLKKFSLKYLKNITKLINAEKVKMTKVARSYQSINKYAADLTKNIYLLDGKITRLTEKWRKQNQLKFKKNCLIFLYSQVKQLQKEAKGIRLTSFSYGNQPSLNLSHIPGFDNSNAYGMSGKKRSPEKDLEEARAQAACEEAEQIVEEAKSSAADAKEMWKLALKIIREHAERQSQNIAALTRI